MKIRKLIPFLIAIFAFATIFAQAPQKMSYQSIVRNSNNGLVANQVVGVRISFVEGSETGPTVYSETHTVTTNANGLFTLEAGGGTPTAGTFTAINWGSGAHFIKSEIDPTGGTNYTLIATKELLSVPYALNGITTAQTQAITSLQAQINNLLQQVEVLQKPQLSMSSFYDAGANAAGTSVTITNSGVGDIVARGLVWSTSPNPTVVLSTKTFDGVGAGTFDSIIETLTLDTTYFVRAYATNEVGTTYSTEVSLTIRDGISTLTTFPVTAITASTATSGGTIASDGGAGIDTRGLVWSTSTNPTVDLDTKTVDGYGTGTFESAITGLTPATKYYARVYATSGAGTVYGTEVSFTTRDAVVTIATTPVVTNLRATTITTGGTIASDGGSPIVARGVVWSTSPNPTVALSTKTVDGSGSGTYNSTVTDLALVTTYYLRAYATNEFGTYYGSEVSFIIMDGISTLSTFPVTTITATTATSGGSITSDGGSPVVARGVVWSTSPNPTVALSTKTVDGSGTGTFDSTITGLTPETTYYLRAYATNQVGTVYGSEVSFTTGMTLVTIGTQIFTTINLDVTTYSDGTAIPEVQDQTQWENLTTGAWCYYNNDPANGTTYGKLYNWYAVAGIWNEASKTDTTQRKKLAPTGYHVPSDAEWTTLTDYLGGQSIAGGKMKATGTSLWTPTNKSATNTSGFSGLPGSRRSNIVNVAFSYIGNFSYWWSSSESNSIYSLIYDNGYFYKQNTLRIMGVSVRCIKD